MSDIVALPAISVILPTATDFSAIRRTVRALRDQTVRERIELVIIGPGVDLGVIESEVSCFANVIVLDGGPVTTSSAARTIGIMSATAPIVAMSEDHSFPDPGWAEAFIAAHGEGYAVVGPVFRNANPRSSLSWANLLLEYAPWFDGAGRAEATEVPGHSSAYRRDLLVAYGDRLGELFEIEAVVHRELVSAGHKLLIEPAAKTNHLNFSRFAPSMTLRYHLGRAYAGYRMTGWSVLTRLGYVFGAPLIPAVRFARVVATVAKSPVYSHLLPRILPHLALGLLADGCGQLVGYIAGPGESPNVLGSIEFDRQRFMSAHDCRELDSADALIAADKAFAPSSVAVAV